MAYIRSDGTTAPTYPNSIAINLSIAASIVPLLDQVPISRNIDSTPFANRTALDRDREITHLVQDEVLASIFRGGAGDLQISAIIVEGHTGWTTITSVANRLGLTVFDISEAGIRALGLTRARLSLGGISGGFRVITNNEFAVLVFGVFSSNLLSPGPHASPAAARVVVEGHADLAAAIREEAPREGDTPVSEIRGQGAYGAAAQEELLLRSGAEGTFQSPRQRGGVESGKRATVAANKNPSLRTPKEQAKLDSCSRG
ncbi:hypothetical protein TrCOL_g1984, partial [Triparma columacea]